MFIRKFMLFLVFLGSTSALACEEGPQAAAKRYLEAGRSVVTELGLPTSNAESVVAAITGMLDDAKPVATAFGAKHTQCAEQIAKLIELYPQIDVWTPQEIRRNIEGGTALPSAEGCYAARDVVAHPAIVRAISRVGIVADQKARLIREMNEAIEHMEEIERDLGQK